MQIYYFDEKYFLNVNTGKTKCFVKLKTTKIIELWELYSMGDYTSSKSYKVYTELRKTMIQQVQNTQYTTVHTKSYVKY